MTLRPALTVLALVLGATSLAGCRDDPPAVHTEAVVAGDKYVALGDSYTAAPGIGTPDGHDGCFRSQNNYPHLVADALGVDLVDVSCGGANTTAVTGSQTTLTGHDVRPQIDALGPSTDLVTISIGGNDFGLFSLVSRICPALAQKDPDGQPCVDAGKESPQDLGDLLRLLRKRLVIVLHKVTEAAPNAIVLAVGYPSVIPEHGTCAALPVATGDYPLVLKVMQGLNASLEAAADQTDVRFVDVYSPTLGHDICGERPWIAGAKVTEGRGTTWHPYAAEQEAVAQIIEDALAEE